MAARDAVDAIRRNKTILQDILSADYTTILDKVFENKLITQREYINLKSINKESVVGHVTSLVDKIMFKGEDTSQAFIRLLQSDKDITDTFPDLKDIQWHNSSLSSKRPPSDQDSAPNTTLCGSDPAPSPIPNDGIPVQETKRRKEDDQYQLTSTPIGLCVIINNETFVDDRRYGTSKDADSLAVVFSWLGFKVLMCKDQTKDQMDMALKVFASLKDLPDLQKCSVKEWSGGEFTDLKTLPQHGDAFVCCLLSHGLSGVVQGIDRKSLPHSEITSSFNGVNCPALINKPKVFFIQACQGTKIQRGVVVDCAEADLQADTSPGQVICIPVGADFLVAIATVDNYVSFRHKEEGTWFIQSLCQELKEGCQRGDDIMAILYRVNDEVSQKGGMYNPGAAKQMPEAKNVTLRKKLVFSPRGPRPQ